MNQFIVFKSQVTKAIYLYNKSDDQVVCIKSSPSRTFGKIMIGLNEVNFEKLLNNQNKTFTIGGAMYYIINRF